MILMVWSQFRCRCFFSPPSSQAQVAQSGSGQEGCPAIIKIQMVSFPVCCLVLPVRCIGRIGPTHAACPPQDPSSIPFSRNLIDSVIFHTIYLYLLRKLAFSRTKILAFVTAVPAGFSFSFAFSMFTSSYKTWLCFN